MKYVYCGYVYEAVSINKDYLLRLVGGDVNRLNEIKSSVGEIVSKGSSGFNASVFPEKSRVWLTNQLTAMAIKESLPSDLSSTIHDLLVDGKLGLLQQLNSDSKVSDLQEIIRSYRASRMTHSKEKLTSDEECIWLRVKLFHEFDDGYKWVNAVDAEGNLAGFIPSEVTFKTMNHCGNTPSVQPGDVYYGLRDANNAEYLSVIIDAEGRIRESKGHSNKRPTVNVKKYVQWLMKHENVKGTNYGAGYARHMNYGVSHMTDDAEFMSYVNNEKPSLVDETEGLVIELKSKLDRGEITADDVINKFYSRKDFESFSFEQLIGILGSNPFSEDEIISLAKEDHINCLEVANAGKEYLTVKVQHAFVDLIAVHAEADGSDYDMTEDLTVLTLISLMGEVPNNKIDGYYLFLNQGDAISLNSFEPDPIPGFMKNSKPMLDKVMSTPRLANYFLYDVTQMPMGDIDFLKEYSDIIHAHIQKEIDNASSYHILDHYIEAACKSGLVYGYEMALGLADSINKAGNISLNVLKNIFYRVNRVTNEKLLELYVAYKPAILSISAKSSQGSISAFISLALQYFRVDAIKLKFVKEFSEITINYFKSNMSYDGNIEMLAYEDGYDTFWHFFPNSKMIKDQLSDEAWEDLLKHKPASLNESLVYRGYVYEAVDLNETYSHANKAVLDYLRDTSVDLGNGDVSYIFSKWLEDNGYESEYNEFNDDYFDTDGFAAKYPSIVEEFSEWLPDNSHELHRMGSGYTKAHMDLMKPMLLPRSTWLIHFSDSAVDIARSGFKRGASDVGDLGLTRGGDGYPGYNFAFLSNRIEDSEKYGEDAVVFQSSGVHVFHIGDDENQIIFYGPDVKEIICIRKYKDGSLINDNIKSPDYEYAIMSNKDLSTPIRKFETIEKAVEFIKINYMQYANKIINKIK